MIPNAPAVEIHGMDIGDLFDEAKHWLSGSGVHSPEDAEGVAKLLDKVRQARKAADEQRKVEKAPHDEAGKAVQKAWVPLLEKCDLAVDACKKALTPWQVKLENEQRAAAEAALAEADRLEGLAREQHQSALGDDLTAKEVASDTMKQAEAARKVANKLDKAKPQVAGETRAIGLRTSYRAEIVDMTLFSRWAWVTRREEYEVFLSDLAEREGRRGPVSIPGLIVHTERRSA